MHIAIDDSYGPETETGSEYVTGQRRTHTAVVFRDDEVDEVRGQIRSCLDYIAEHIPVRPAEFHFVDIYNRKAPWDLLPKRANLGLIGAFAEIYSRYRWEVVVQTIDQRTLADHRIEKFPGKVDGLDLTNRTDLSLAFLLVRIKHKYMHSKEPLSLFADEGRRKPGATFANGFFWDWPSSFRGAYASSADEPLLQIADFVAYCINRSTHLSMKATRTEVDNWFLHTFARMNINCDDLKRALLPIDFSVADFDALHRLDRQSKGLE